MTYGAPVAPPVLLLHGCPFSSFVWRKVIPPLSDKYRWIAPDLLYLGDNETLWDPDWSLRSQAAMVVGFLDQLGLERAHVVGHDHGRAMARWLCTRNVIVVEVDRPDRRTRRRRGKSDSVDAEAAARAVLAGTATAQPKAGNGAMEMVRTLRVTRQSAIKARMQAANELHALVVTAPDALRAHLRRLKLAQLIATAVAFRMSPALTTPAEATKLALKSIARRYQQLSAEIDALDKHLDQLVARAAPALVAIKGVGTDIGATLLTIAGDNPERLNSQGAFAHLIGIAPIEASSGKITRYRLKRGGDRQGNRALYLLAVGRMGWDPATKAYVGAPHGRRAYQAGDHPLSSGTSLASSIPCCWLPPPDLVLPTLSTLSDQA